MSIDLTALFEEAARRRHSRVPPDAHLRPEPMWPDFDEAMASLRRDLPDAELDWDGPGEDWARFLLDDKVVAIARVDTPLAFVNARHARAAKDLEQVGYVVILAPAWDEDMYRLDSGITSGALSYWTWRGPDEDPEKASWSLNQFSVSTLWWATL